MDSAPGNGLFRQAALQAKSRVFAEDVTLATPLGHVALTALFLSVATLVVLFLVFGTYTKKEKVRGFVTTTEANVKVYPQSSGTILDVLVAEGDVLAGGQALFTISTARANRMSSDFGVDAAALLQAEAKALEGEIERQKDYYAARAKTITLEIESLHARITLTREQKTLAADRLELAEKALRRLAESAASQYTSMSERDQGAAVAKGHEMDVKALQREIHTLESEILAREREKSELPLLRDLRLAQLDREKAQLQQKTTEHAARDRQQIIAPSAGRVTGITARRGQTVSADTPIASLVPENSVYYVVLVVPSRSIGFVEPGSSVNVQYDAFPHQKFGTYAGIVASLSKSVNVPGELTVPVAVSEPFFLATADLEQQHVEVYGKRQVLRPGMTLSADIVRDRRRLFEWLFEPVIGAGRRW